ncbi:Aste57867_8282 [Aphanomyces stellatus]|uniref:Amino acid transporter n=1 Tax=Aphanomyces stellatus TaxID=120398 RepID=A0A485KJW3_9STRA|nr:hypothetical protein As57867_008251 [Aphanomyces stellatus]VFT85169.1 Aste57867_8282 [Aphanomyces stellatus]
MAAPPPRKPQGGGVLLFDASESVASIPSTASSSTRARNAGPYAAYNLRTNFTASSMQTVDCDSPMLGDLVVPSPVVGIKDDPSAGADGMQTSASSYTLPFRPVFVLVGAIVGLGLGALLAKFEISAEWQKAVALPGDLFVRALQCLIVPMVFCVMTVVVAESSLLGNMSIMRWRTLLPYMLTSLLATAEGVLLAVAFQSHFTTTVPRVGMGGQTSRAAFNLTMQCANGLFLAVSPDGALACVEGNGTAATALFLAVNRTAAMKSAAVTAAVQQLSLVDQVVAIANVIVPVNIFQSLASGSLLSIVMFAIPMGIAVAISNNHAPHELNIVLTLFKQTRDIFLRLLHMLLVVTPVAVAFLLMGAVAKFGSQHLGTAISQLGFLFGAVLAGAAFHMLVVLPTLLFVWTKTNPFAYLQHLFPAYVLAFGCASSMATLPVAIECLQRAKVSRSLAHVAMPFGTPVNMNGGGIYYPLCFTFMASMAGMELTPGTYVLLFFVSYFGCVGTAPVPNAGLVYNMTLWQTCYPSTPLPVSFAFIVAADFVLDRIATVMNVNGNAVVVRILDDQMDETFDARVAAAVNAIV